MKQVVNTSETIIDAPVIHKILGLLDHGLTCGVGYPEPGKMCVEAAICYALGLPHGDDPGCVSSAVRLLKIELNDSRWESNQARAKGLRRLAVIQLGTKDVIDDREFARRASMVAIRICVANALRAAAKAAKGKHVKVLLEVALLCANEPTHANALKAKAATAAAYAAANADYAAANAYAADYAAANAADAVLAEFAEAIVQILIEMKAPAAKWLYLTEQT